MNPTEAAEEVMGLMCSYLESSFGTQYDFEVGAETANPYLVMIRIEGNAGDSGEPAVREYHLSVTQIMSDMIRPRTIHEQVEEAWDGDDRGMHALTPTGKLILTNLVRDS